MKILLLLTLTLLLSETKSYFGTVIGVADGDTIIVLIDPDKQIKVRLEGIDCPELSQAFAEDAKLATVALCFKKRVRVDKTGIDKYGRTLAFVYVNDICINKELLKEGMAWHYKEFNNDPELAKLEEDAKAKKIGLWEQTSPIPPWDYRHQ